jgi:transposase
VPGDEEPPPSEVLTALVASLRRELAEAVAALGQARSELAQARERIAELETRLKQNSSRPPSSEGLDKPPPRPRSLRNKSGRKPGGQDGHAGTTLAQAAGPDREIRHEPGCCGRCGAGLAGRPVTGVERRQVFDLPEVTIKVTEHQLIERECGCGQRTKAAAPQGAEAPVQYGPRVAAIIVYLYALAAQIRLYRSAALAGASQTAARCGALMKKHHALARRLLARQDDYLRFTTDFRAPLITTDLSATYGWPSCGKRYPAASGPSPAPASSARYAATCRPPPNTASASSTPSSCSPKANPGCLPPPDQTTTISAT